MTALGDRDAATIAGVEKLRFFPLEVVGGHGSILQTADGRELIDLSASWGAASIGYAHPAIAASVGAVLEDMPSASILSSINEPAVRLGERLLACTPGGGERRVWFGHSGSDANEAALRCVLRATGRDKVIAFAGAYHGGSVGSMAISGHPSLDEDAHLPGLLQVPYPDPAVDHDGAAALAAIDDLLETRCPPEEVAAVWVEPILSDGGVVVPPRGFLARLADRCSSHGILLVCDEVKAGLGRTGSLPAFVSEDITPDVVCVGKGLGGGLPLSAFIGPVEVTDHATAFAMLTTAGNPVCAAAGLAVLGTIEREGLVARAAEMGKRLTEALNGLADHHHSVGDVRGRGLMVGVEVVQGEDGISDPTATAKVCYRAFELGVAIFSVGVHGNVLEFTPALTIATEEIDRAVAILDRAFADVEAGLVPDEAVAPFAGW